MLQAASGQREKQAHTMHRTSHKHTQALDDVAGDLLQLREKVARGSMPDFDSLDKDHKGSLSADEFKALTSFVGDAEEVFKKIDFNGSGKIDKEEYNKAVKDGLLKPENFPATKSNAFRPALLTLWAILLSALLRYQ